MADIKTLVEEARRYVDDLAQWREDDNEQLHTAAWDSAVMTLDALAEAHQAEIARLTRENEGLATDNAICRDAIAHALELVEQFAASPDGDDDMSQGAARATRRRLNEAIGQMRPRLMMEKDFSPKFGLRWKELRAENEGLAKDAARYRSVRRGQHWSVIDGIGNDLRAEILDAAIDAALAGASGASHG